MFSCNLCNYSTERSTDLERHNKSKKHIKKVHNNLSCNLKNALEVKNVTNIGLHDIEMYQQIDNWKKSFQKKSINFAEQINNVIPKRLHEKKITKKYKQVDLSTNTIIENSDDGDINKTTKKSIIKQYFCDCGKEFNHRQNLWRHRNVCKNKIQKKIQTEEVKKQHKEELQAMQAKIDSLEKTITNFINLPQQSTFYNTNNNNLYSHNNNSNNLIHNTLNNNQKIVVFNYVNQNFNDVEPIKMLEKKDIDDMLVIKHDTTYTLVDFLIYNQNNHNLNEFLGDIILTAYKKEDPEEQQIWTSSVLKLTFIARQILNKEKVWLKDMNGVSIIKHIIDPILKEIKKILQKYIKNIEKEKKCESFEEIEKSQNIGIIALDIIKEINDKELHKKILKYIALHFQLEHNILVSKSK